MATRAKAGASISVLATIFTTLLLGGQLAGGALMMPLVAFAGITLDVAGHLAERRRFSVPSALVLWTMAAVAGNLICLIKRLFDPVGQMFSTGNIRDLLQSAASYALCGLIAGLCGAICGLTILHRRQRRA